MTDPEHACKIIGYLVLSALAAVNPVDELIECFADCVHVDVILVKNTLCNLIGHITVDVSRCRDQVLLDAGEGGVLLDVKVDELVGDDAHSLQSKGLDTRAREALHNPALTLLLEVSDFFFDKIDDDIIVDHLEVVEALRDASRVNAAVLNVLTEELANGNAFPFEVLADGFHVLLTLTAGGTKKEDTADCVHLDLLKEELERVIRSANDQLL